MNHYKMDRERFEDAEKEFLSHLPRKLEDIAEEIVSLQEERRHADPIRLEEIEDRLDELKDRIYHIIADSGKDRRMMN